MNYIETINNTSFEMIHIPGGKFEMGSEQWDDTKPIHRVSVPDFHLAKYPVTQELWQAVMDTNPSYFKGAQRPVESVSWHDAQAFIKKLNAETGKTYALPSEAQWEYAARGGQKSKGFRYAGSDKLKEVGWYDLNSHRKTKVVGRKLPNELGLYDMSGNVWEWCADVWYKNYEGAPQDGSVWREGGEQNWRVVRGGSWLNYDTICRVSDRYWDYVGSRNFSLGFRLARH